MTASSSCAGPRVMSTGDGGSLGQALVKRVEAGGATVFGVRRAIERYQQTRP